MSRRRINPMTAFGLPWVGGGVLHPVSEYQWFVDKNWGKAFGTGEAQDHPLENLQDAIDKTVSGRGDVIYVGAGGAEVTETVSFNKSGISVIAGHYGMSRRAMGEYHSIYAASTFTDGPVATITAPCYIDGLAFASRDTGATFWSGAAALIGGLGTAGPYGVHMNNCRFPKWGLDNRIGLAIEGSSNVEISNCGFEGAFASGIYVQGACGHLWLHDNDFSLATYAVTHGAFSDAGVNTQMKYGPGNVTIGPTKFLESGSNAVLGSIYGNFFGTAVGTSTNDLNVADMETLGLTCVGNEYATEGPGPT